MRPPALCLCLAALWGRAGAQEACTENEYVSADHTCAGCEEAWPKYVNEAGDEPAGAP